MHHYNTSDTKNRIYQILKIHKETESYLTITARATLSHGFSSIFKNRLCTPQPETTLEAVTYNLVIAYYIHEQSGNSHIEHDMQIIGY